MKDLTLVAPYCPGEPALSNFGIIVIGFGIYFISRGPIYL